MTLQKEIHFFQSANLTDNEIKQHFVVRINEYNRIIDEIRKDNMKGSIQHFILIGRRGSGKSTLLRRIHAEINTDDVLVESLVVVNPSEEQAGVYRLYDVWDMVIKELKLKGYEVEDISWHDYQNDLKTYTEQLYRSIQKVLKKENKKLILLLDNIDRIFDNIKDDSKLLRELLTNYNDIRIVGGSTRMSEHYWKYEKPFYQFFSLLRLDALTVDEIKTLLLYWSDHLEKPEIRYFVKHHSEKLNVVRTLTDGMPRTLLYFVKLLIDRPQQNGFDYLRLIIDKATPIYQERLSKLPPAQQKIVLELSFFWDAVKVKPLIEKCRMTGKVISAQLNQLVKTGVVNKIKGLKKDNLYIISERFFNLWLLMTQGGPEEKYRVKYLTVFLESWYGKEELQNILNEHINHLKTKKIQPGHAALMSKALVHSKFLSIEQRDSLIEGTLNYQGIEKEDLIYLPEPSNKIFDKVVKCINTDKYKQAKTELNKIDQNCGEKYNLLAFIYFYENDFKNAEINYLQAIDKGYVGALYNLAVLYSKTDRQKEAEKYYLQAINKGDVDALNNLANLYSKTDRQKEAEKYYLQAIDKGDVGALYNLANLYSETDRQKEAEKYYLQAIDKGNVGALNNLANLYSKTDRQKEAEKYYLQAIDKGYVGALNNLANLYSKTDRQKEAEKYYLQAINKGDVGALNNLANLYSETDRQKEAEKYYLQAIDKGNVGALNNLANLYSKTDRQKEAEKYYLQAIDKGDVGALYNLANLYTETDRQKEAEKYYLQAIDKGYVGALNNLAYLYSETDRKKEAEKYYLQAIDKGDVDALYNLAYLYYSENQKCNEVLGLIKKATHKDNDLRYQAASVVFQLWAGRIKEFDKMIQSVFVKILAVEDISILEELIKDMLIHYQYHMVWEWFSAKDTGDKLKKLVRPLYFVAAGFILKTETKEELLKAGPEIQESIEQIREYILERQKFYYGKKSK